MIITVAGAGDVEVDPGTALSEILTAVRAPASVWCGGTRLDPGHRAGVAPLTHAALLTPTPAPPCSPPTGPCLVVVAGPDAGDVLTAPRDEAAVGRAGTMALDDARLSRRHLGLDAAGRVRDLGSRNGTVLRRAGRRIRVGRLRRRLRPGDLLEAGDSMLAWHDPAHVESGSTAAEGAQARTPRASVLTTGLAGAGAGAVALAATTGRWMIALAVLAAPLAVAATAAMRAPRRRLTAAAPTHHRPLSDLPAPVAVVGAADRARGAARALALARGAPLPDALAEPWMRWLDRRPPVEVTLVTPGDAPPSEARAVVDVDAREIIIDGRAEHWHPAIVSPAAADRAARRAAAERPADLPASVRWGEIADFTAPPRDMRAPHAKRRLEAVVGIGHAGPVSLDLDRDGPHLLIAGTTGAGKSALLETLVGALALRLGPHDLGIGLVDLKGGTGMAGCAELPHVRGTLTDLEPSHARRALLGIAAELRQRKRALSAAGHASWTEWELDAAAPPRLLVVVDEFQELGAMDPGFVPELTRLAAQGRALGMHLVLATQRPAGAVTPAIRANVGTVVALRTAGPAESQDLLGDAAAAALPPDTPGRAIVQGTRGRILMQTALALADARPAVRRLDRPTPPGRTLARAARERWPDVPAAPLWLAPLAATAAAHPGALGWIDRPAERRREPLAWDPASGPCVVVGPRGGGRSTALAAVARALPGCVRLPEDPREAARTLTLAGVGTTALLIDDAELALARLEGQLRGAEQAVEALARRIPVALACGPGWGARWASRAGLRIVLTGLDRVEQALWGVPSELVDLPREPGRAVVVGATAPDECRIERGPWPATARLVTPLACPPHLPDGAVGVYGDHARPLRLPHHGVTVVGRDGAERGRVLGILAAAGIAAQCADRPRADATVVVVATPTVSLLRECGVRVMPGLVDEAPPPGRVVVVRGETAEPAQLRDAAR